MAQYPTRQSVPVSARWAAAAVGFGSLTYIVYYGLRMYRSGGIAEGLFEGTWHSSLVMVLWSTATVVLLLLGVALLRPRLLHPAAVLAFYLILGHLIASAFVDRVSVAFVLSNGAELCAAAWLMRATAQKPVG